MTIGATSAAKAAIWSHSSSAERLTNPTWDTPRCVRGTADKVAGYLRTYVDLGVDQIQVGFVSRSADELCDQIAAFATDVAPLVND